MTLSAHSDLNAVPTAEADGVGHVFDSCGLEYCDRRVMHDVAKVVGKRVEGRGIGVKAASQARDGKRRQVASADITHFRRAGSNTRPAALGRKRALDECTARQ